jgi:hypothetical protein
MPKPPRRRAALKTLNAGNEPALLDMTRRWQALRLEMRRQSLRKRVGPRVSMA